MRKANILWTGLGNQKVAQTFFKNFSIFMYILQLIL